MVAPVITALYGALNAILNIMLANHVSTLRRRHKVSLGSHPDIEVAIRIHSNNAESVPLAIVMLLLCELCGAPSAVLHSLGGALLVSRILHAIGMPKPSPNPYRFMGTALTWGMILGTSAYTLYLRFTI
jgi:uncharacterized membrane protein YecN with MAPEG domain